MLRLALLCMVLLVAVQARNYNHKNVNTWGATVKANENSINKNKTTRARDCQDHWNAGARKAGVHIIYPNSTYAIKVFCEHTATDTATVIQRRASNNETFYRTWYDYKRGFGHPQYDYWMGLEAIHHLTFTGQMKLVLALQDWALTTQYMTYNTFLVADESHGYQLQIGGATGYLPDDMAHSNYAQFATYDRPDTYSCAIHQRAGWWYNYCAFTLLNGQYYYGGRYPPVGSYYDGIYWKDWYGYDYSLRYVSMAIMRK